MPITPAIPFGGLPGYRLLERTYETQVALFNKSPDLDRDIAYFLEKAPEITTVDGLMSDRRVLQVVLGAFGLDEDINKGAFIRKVIEDGTLDSRSFANRLVEPAYREMSEFLGFGNFIGTLDTSSAQQEIVARYRERQFELAVGEVDIDMRLGLNFEREATRIVAETANEDTAWLRLLGTTSLRTVVESAFFLPAQFAQIELDQQLDVVKDRAKSLFGTSSPQALLDPSNMDRMVERFLIRQQALNGGISANTPGSTALTLLQAGLGAGAQQNLFASNFL